MRNTTQGSLELELVDEIQLSFADDPEIDLRDLLTVPAIERQVQS